MASVCIVDDNEGFCELTRDILSKDDYEFSMFHDYTSDIHDDIVEKVKPDVILLDINLPSAKGFDVASDLLFDLDDPCQIIFISGLASDSDKLKAFEAGGFDYIDKPVDPLLLIAKVAVAIKASEKEKQNTLSLGSLRTTMFESMTQAAELGSLLRFTDEAASCNDFEHLSVKLFELFSELSLDISLAINSASGGETFYFNDGVERPLEKEILISLKHDGRLIDFGARTIVNEKNASFLIRNMPVDDEAKYGMIRDNICFIITAIQTKVEQIDMCNALAKKQSQVDISNQVIANIIASLEDSALEFTKNSVEELENLTMVLSEEFSAIDMTESEESIISGMLSNSSDRLHALFVKSSEDSAAIRNILSELVSNS